MLNVGNLGHYVIIKKYAFHFDSPASILHRLVYVMYYYLIS